jgi:chromosome segregation ATPase
MTSPAPPQDPGLVRAAQDLEDEIRLCEEAVTEASKVRLNTDKNIGRAARALKKASDHREQVGVKVNALLGEIQAAHARAAAAIARMDARATEIQARLEQLRALQEHAGQIIAAAREVSEFSKEAKDKSEILARLVLVDDRVALALKEARAGDFDDVAHELSGLREMIASMRRKLGGE